MCRIGARKANVPCLIHELGQGDARRGSKRPGRCRDFYKLMVRGFTPQVPGSTVCRVSGVCKTTILICGLSLLSCAPPQEPQTSERPAKLAGAESALDDATPRSIPVAEVLGGSIGPHLVETEHGFTLAWASPTQDGYQLLTSFITGGASTEPREILRFDQQLFQLILSRHLAAGITLLSVSRSKEGDRLELIELGEEGELRLPRRLLRNAQGRIVWAQAENVGGSDDSQLIFWAEKQGQHADIYVMPLRSSLVGRSYQLERDVLAWQLVELGGKAALATLSSSSFKAGLSLRLRLIDEGGQLVGEPILVSELKQGGLDLDMVSQGDQLVLAWSEKVSGWSRLRLANVDVKARKSTTKLATPPRGDQTLLKLLNREHEINVIWEEPRLAVDAQRQVWFGAILASESYPLTPLGHLRLADSDPLLPSFAGDKTGIALTAYGKLCEVQGSIDDASCESGPAQRFFARFDGRNVAYASRLSRQTAPEAAALVWELQCGALGGDRCVALVSDGASPNRVFLFDSSQEETQPKKQWVASYLPITSGVAHVVSKEVLRQVPELSKLSAVGTEDRTILSWLSYFDPNVPADEDSTQPAPDGRQAPVRALLTTETFSGDANSFEQTPVSNSISLRARSWGGLASATSERTSLLAWAALDQDDPQLFATIVDARGKKLRQKMLTHSTGEVFDVAVSRVPDGYAIVWIDGQNGNLEVWAMHVDEQLNAGPALQISHGAISPTEVSLAVVSDQLVIVWTDIENAQQSDFTSLRLASVDAQVRKVIMQERLLNTGEAATRSPQVAVLQGETPELILGYISGSMPSESDSLESDPDELSQFGYGQLQYVMLPIRGVIGAYQWDDLAPQHVNVPAVGAFSLDCTDKCRAVIASKESVLQDLWLSEFNHEGARTSKILSLNTPSPETSVPLLWGRHIFYADTLEPGGPFQLLKTTLTWHSQRQ